jgi:hypothetical protein
MLIRKIKEGLRVYLLDEHSQSKRENHNEFTKCWSDGYIKGFEFAVKKADEYMNTLACDKDDNSE